MNDIFSKLVFQSRVPEICFDSYGTLCNDSNCEAGSDYNLNCAKKCGDCNSRAFKEKISEPVEGECSLAQQEKLKVRKIYY